MTLQELAQLIIATGRQAEDLRAEADRVRWETVGDDVHLRGLIEFSNHCRCNCLYCGLRRENNSLARYRMAPKEIVDAAEQAVALGFGTVVLQSGEDLWYTGERLAGIISEIKSRTGAAVALSVGEREDWEYRLWREAGADRYLLRHETSDPELYACLHPGASLRNRIRCLEVLGELGYEVGSGPLIGLPAQTPEILAQDLLLLKRLNVHMAGMGPFIPSPSTPLASALGGSPEITLNMLALTRILIPDIMLPATTALETSAQHGCLAGLRAGANVIMPNLTPRRYACLYELYPGKKAPTIGIAEEVERVRGVVAAADRLVATGPGSSPRALLAVTYVLGVPWI